MKTLAAALPVLLLGLSGCMEHYREVHGTKVDLYDDYFGEIEKTVAKGTELEFENEGARDHTVTIHLPPANGTDYEHDKVLQPGGEDEFDFETPGVYHVFCRFHGEIGKRMHLNVTVTA
jgi:plastocyanin